VDLCACSLAFRDHHRSFGRRADLARVRVPLQAGASNPGPPWSIKHQPRFDWQMWFAAYRGVAENPWFGGLILELLKGSPPVLALFASDPFSDHPPEYVRALLYDHHFAQSATFARTGQWWERRLEGLCFPPVSLTDLQRVGVLDRHAVQR
jgi:Lipase maturation factor